MPAQEDRVSSIFIIPLLQCIVGAFLVIALLNRERDLAIVTILILVIMIGARLWSRWSIVGTNTWARVDKYKAFPDERLHVDVQAENRKWLPIQLYIEMPVTGALEPINRIGLNNECRLLWYQKAHFQWDFLCVRRGVYRIGPPRIETGDLFGFFSKRKRYERAPNQIIVYPRLIPLKSIAFPRRDFFGQPGAKSPVQDPIYIMGTRDYQSRRPARYIHWKASARHNRLQEKVFEPSAQENLFLVVDVTPFEANNARDEFERALEAVASLAVQCDQKGFALGLLTNGVVEGAPAFLPVSRSTQQLANILETLARLDMKTTGPLLDLLRNGCSFHWGISSICFSCGVDASWPALEHFFAYRKIPMMFIACGKGVTSEQEIDGVHCRVMTIEEICIQRGDP
ncbi:MAG: DUF58 domain-containing protein [Deltaproteobacteria bacterium]|nr:DUF58 domain-containing protein [Deltaproteobacteria bacterium]